MSLRYLAYLGTSCHTSTKGRFIRLWLKISKNFLYLASSFFLFRLYGKGCGELPSISCLSISSIFSASFTGLATDSLLGTDLFRDQLLQFSPASQSDCLHLFYAFFSVSLGRAPIGLTFLLEAICPNCLSKFLKSILSCCLWSLSCWLSSKSFFSKSFVVSSACCGGIFCKF